MVQKIAKYDVKNMETQKMTENGQKITNMKEMQLEHERPLMLEIIRNWN